MSRVRVLLGVIAVACVIVSGVLLLGRSRSEMPCGAGFTRVGARCCPSPGSSTRPGVCAFDPASTSCPSPLIVTANGCDAPERDVVEVPPTRLMLGPSDWEAEGRVSPREVTVNAFALDRLEVTAGRACASPIFSGAPFCDRGDPARAAFGVTLARAREYCAARGGRLPTDDEWLAAAGGEAPRRYPWGDTGVVCRRAAWGLDSGPCGEGANGPDTVGAHPDGATPLGIYDLAGNVAEWVEATCEEKTDGDGGAPKTNQSNCPAIIRGGSWRSTLATELRTWLRREVPQGFVDPTVGFRCAYPSTRKP